MYSPEDTPASGPPGNGDSYVNTEVMLTASNTQAKGDVTIVVASSEARLLIGRTVDDNVRCITLFISTYRLIIVVRVQWQLPRCVARRIH